MPGVFGRRGEIVWKKAPFIGSGGRRDYDAYLGWGLLFPIYLTDAVHTWGWGRSGNQAKAIPLRRDPRFRRMAHLQDTGGPIAVLSGILFLPLCCSGMSVTWTLVTLVTFILSATTAFGSKFGRGRRDKNIRLMLGKHAWGSSDPATWHRSLLAGVVEPSRNGAATFAELVDAALDDGAYSTAMWAARICAAVEDRGHGEQLTDEILEIPAVREKLRRARSDPGSASREFGKVTLSTWVSGDLSAPVFTSDGD